ncbi:MAG: hypothetical protein M1818_008326 [Claussenomyces sp. TS43310]|nr:MAG: hypothetical protein M1818_008326 [Claussenomyces sp. TS43310]
MPLPQFTSVRFSRRKREQNDQALQSDKALEGDMAHQGSDVSDSTSRPAYRPSLDIKRATRTRKIAIIASMVLFFIAVIFLILVIIGNISDKAVIRDTWFFQLNLSNIFPSDVPGNILINSIARSVGLHDFYRVGLWNFCEGYNDTGITYCSPPKDLYWFNPVQILLSELLAGASIQLPSQINTILDLIRLASQIMFGFFISGIVMNFISIFIAGIALSSRWWSLPLAIFTFIAALLTTAATIIATVMFIIFKNVITSQPGLNIQATIGTQMFAFMWTATACSLIAFIIHLSLSCCCASRRDVRTGRRTGSKKAYGEHTPEQEAKPRNMRSLFRRRKAAEA